LLCKKRRSLALQNCIAILERRTLRQLANLQCNLAVGEISPTKIAKQFW
jgi:hypothetical protein